MSTVLVRKVAPHAKLPKYATDGSACFDIHSLDSHVIHPGKSISFRTGISFEIDKGHHVELFSRSGMAFNYGIRLGNSVGIIDSDFRGELRVALYNDSDRPYEVRDGDRIAQGLIVETIRAVFKEANELSSTDRGDGGFGSTGD